ncbi:MAG: AAA family ATPase, partial [Coleofasciculaceae cyanobacterium RL_1_1]|nr:AAA family ATPase [Coleofasciculaceae cyanobacterium RL_1_1]
NLTDRLTHTTRVLSLVGITGIGKTSLAQQLLTDRNLQMVFPNPITISFNSESPSFDIVIHALLGQQKYDAKSQSEQTMIRDRALIQALITKLQSKPYLLIFDMLETCLTADEQGQHRFKEPIFEQFFSQFLQAESMASRIIVTSQDQLPVLAEGRYEERIHQELLTGLTSSEAIALFQQWQIEAATLTEADCLQRIITVYEGHPLALQVIAGEMSDAPFCGEILAYWAEHGHEIETIEAIKADPQLDARTDQPRLDRYTVRLKDLVKQRVEKHFNGSMKRIPLLGYCSVKMLYPGFPLSVKLGCFRFVSFPQKPKRWPLNCCSDDF